MTDSPFFVTDRERFEAIVALAGSVFDLGGRFPGKVFRGEERDFLFRDYEAVLVPELWPAICEMARWHGDDEVYMLALEPETSSRFWLQRGYPAVSLPVGADDDDFWSAVGYQSDDDMFSSMAVLANVITALGPSGKWGCWGERWHGVVVFHGFVGAEEKRDWVERHGTFLEYGAELEDFLGMAFRDGVIPAEYATELAENYSPRG